MTQTGGGPCYGCKERRVGCHDPATCARWAAFRAKRDEMNAQKAKAWDEKEVFLEYLNERIIKSRRKMRG